MTDKEFFCKYYAKHSYADQILKRFGLPDTLDHEYFKGRLELLEIYPYADSLLYDSTLYSVPPNCIAKIKYEEKIIEYPFFFWNWQNDECLNHVHSLLQRIDGHRRWQVMPRVK